jgi:hypothetical protein
MFSQIPLRNQKPAVLSDLARPASAKMGFCEDPKMQGVAENKTERTPGVLSPRREKTADALE